MDIILVMCLGIFAGYKFFPKKLKKRNEQLQVAKYQFLFKKDYLMMYVP